MKSHYVIQKTDKSFCAECLKNNVSRALDLLCHEWAGPQRERSFYICWHCQRIYEVGKGEVRRENV